MSGELIIYCGMTDNGFGPLTLKEARERFHCEDDGPKCRDCPCLKFRKKEAK